jgi:CHAT domain-containing protein/tetratricopeptide (TPR) repeat protein
MRQRSLVRLLVAGILAGLATPGGSQETAAERLLPGSPRERPIAGAEVQAYRVEVADEPLLVLLQQQDIPLVLAAGTLRAGAPQRLWGPVVLLLETPGEQRIEVRPVDPSVGPGRYSIEVETLPASAEGRRAALSLLSRAGQEVAAGTPEARRRAIELYRQALAAWRALGERRWEAEALDALTALEVEERDLRPAAEDGAQALALWRELADLPREAAAADRLGIVRSYAGQIDGAREALQGSLALWQQLGKGFDEALTRSSFCFVDQISGALPAALACYEESRAAFRALGDRGQEMRMLNSLGGVYDGLGEPDAALERYEQALALVRAVSERHGEAQILMNIATTRRALGEWQEALRLYGEAREILASLGERAEEATLLNNVGFAYDELGEPQRAVSFFEEALALRRETGNRRGEIITLNNLANVRLHLGEPQKALDLHRQALEQASALGDSRQQALSRLGVGEVQIELGDPQAALRELDPALAVLREAGDHRREAQILRLRGRALARAGQSREALSVFQDALTQARTLGDRVNEIAILEERAAAERSLGLLAEARTHAGQAVAQVEALRAGFVSPNLRAAFLATQRRAYALQIDLLMEAGHDREALSLSERARARSLLDVLHSGHQAGSTVPAALLERRQSLRRRLSAKADQQLKQNGANDTLRREIETLLADLDSIEAEIRRLDPNYAAVADPHPLSVEEIAKLLDPGTLLLEVALGEEHSYLWIVGAGGTFRSVELPPERTIAALAQQLHGELSTVEAGSGRRREAAEALSRLLLKPVWEEASRASRLVVVPDGALHLVPFAALPAPGSGEDLVDRFEIVSLPSATTLALQRRRLEHRPPAAKWAAVFADPVFSAGDPRLAKAGNRPAAKPDSLFADLPRLASSGREAEAITASAPRDQVWAALGPAASREAALSGDLRNYRVIHFATHALADIRNPELSGLVLSLVDGAGQPREGFVGLSDIYDLDLGADLVVLSGCQTGFGKEVRGEGLMDLTRGFLAAGVPRVMASLWRVQDRATAELMTRFYHALWQEHLPAAAALRAAQRALRREEPRYKNASSWAGFVLQGDWR